MDKRWVHLPRYTEEYRKGVNDFISMARAYSRNNHIIVCPCKRCRNVQRHHHELVYEHLVIKGMDPTYTTWVLHGECTTSLQYKEIENKETSMIAMGRTDYACKEHEMKKKVLDETSITRVDVCVQAHFNKDEQPANESIGAKMKQIEEIQQSSEGVDMNSIQNDPIVYEGKKRRRVYEKGFGVNPSKIDTYMQEIRKQKPKLLALEEQMEKINVMLLKIAQSQGIDEVMSYHACTPQSSEESVQAPEIIPTENARCLLLHWYLDDPDEIVAEGKIASVDPKARIHHMPLGRDCWKVWVTNLIKYGVQLYRSTDEARNLDEVVGSVVAWPKSCIKLV